MTRTASELSVVCDERLVPAETVCERGWRAMALEGPIPFETTGVLASLATALAGAGVSVFAISTYDTDVLLVKSTDASRAEKALGEGGFVFGE